MSLPFASNSPVSSAKEKVGVLAIFLVVGTLLSIALSITVPPQTSRADMPGGTYYSGGIFNPRPTLFGLLDPQTSADGTTYSWSTSHTTVTFPYEAYLGRYADVSLRLASLRKAGQPDATVNISLNGVAYPTIRVPNAFTEYQFKLDTRNSPNPYLDPAHIQLDIQSTIVISNAVTVSAPDDSNDLGVAVDWIELTPQRDARDVILMLGAWLAGVMVVLLIALYRFSLRWAITYGAGTLLTFTIVTLTYVIRPFPSAYEVGLAGLAWIVAAALAPVKQPAAGLLLVVFCLWVALAGRMLVDWQTDDSYISYRYAWNLIHGQGLVYNPGEVVEGYTNFLWTLLAAVFISAGFQPAGLMLTSTIALSTGLVGATFYIGRRISDGSFIWPFFAVIVLVVDSSFITYGPKGSGLEAVPFGFLILLALALLWWRGKTLTTPSSWLIAGGVVLALASLMRPEGLGVAALFFIVKAWQAWSEKERVGHTLLYCALPYLAILVPYEIWRITFYGYLFPNTFYAKTDTTLAFVTRGWTYTSQFITDHWFVIMLVIGGMLLFSVRMIQRGVANRALRPDRVEVEQVSVQVAKSSSGGPEFDAKWIVRALTLLVVFYTLYVIAVGGDHFPEGRFFVPLSAPLALLGLRVAYILVGMVKGTERTRSNNQPRISWLRYAINTALAVGIVSYVTTSLLLQDPGGELSRRTRRDTNFVNIWGSAGLWLRDNTSTGVLGASPVAGAIAFYSQHPIVDMLGITDAHIAHKQVATMGTGLAGHEKEDSEYVLNRKPAYILPYPDYFTNVEEQFSSQYITTTVRGPLGPDIIWWQRRDSIESVSK